MPKWRAIRVFFDVFLGKKSLNCPVFPLFRPIWKTPLKPHFPVSGAAGFSWDAFLLIYKKFRVVYEKLLNLLNMPIDGSPPQSIRTRRW